jgi:hypothetical protein
MHRPAARRAPAEITEKPGADRGRQTQRLRAAGVAEQSSWGETHSRSATWASASHVEAAGCAPLANPDVAGDQSIPATGDRRKRLDPVGRFFASWHATRDHKQQFFM